MERRRTVGGRRIVILLLATACSAVALRAASSQRAPADQTIRLRGRDQILHLYGAHTGTPIIVSSGDGGWIHLGPHVAEVLAAGGYFVIGFDVRGYLESFTEGTKTLGVEDEPRDYARLIDFAVRETNRKPILIGVSEGAGLSVLAATDAANRQAIAGVIGLGLCDLTELGWRWRDMAIYVTHGTPHEPTFSVKAIVDRLAPVPLAAIQSTRDEFAPLSDVEQILDRAHQPKRLWIVSASNHRFSDNLGEFDRALIDAVTWVSGIQSGVAK